MAEQPKSFFLSSEAHAYLVAHSRPQDDVLATLVETTEREVGPLAIMQVAPEQGAFMQLLVAATGARRAVEVGTFTGYSAICIARGLPDDGQLLCLDTSEEWTALARSAWEKANIAHKIELRIAPAVDTLRSLPEEPSFDFAFIDADKTQYATYYEEILKRMPAGGLIVCDNVLWAGAVINPEAQDENTLAIRAFNDLVAADPRVETSMIAVGDGLLLARKL